MPLTRASPSCARSPPKPSSTASCSMCCPKASSRCVTLASSHLAAANACWLCANDTSRSIQSIWGIRKPHLNQANQPQSQSCAAQVAVRRCCSSVSFTPLGAVHHELFCFSAPDFLLDAGFHACTRVCARLMPGNIHPNAFFAGSPDCTGRLFGCTIQGHPFDGGFDQAGCLKSQMAWYVS
jgi:hypothetical protein